ncbi:MAG: DUF4147 domain-containing protein [Blastocatellia bacterium]
MIDLKETAKRIFLETLRSIEPAAAINKHLRVEGNKLTVAGDEIDLDTVDDVVLIGMGKASLKMGSAVEGLLGDRIKRGVLVTDRRSSLRVKSEVIVAGHPLPDSNSLIAGDKIIRLVKSCTDRSLILFLVSGGGSSLVESPCSPRISLDDLREANRVLVSCGASIREINIIRKYMSGIKGGRLGYLARNSKWVGMYLSDVNPDDLRSIASNPLLPEEVRAEAVDDVMTKFKLIDALPSSIIEALRDQKNSSVEMDWIRGHMPFSTVLLLENRDAVQAAAELAGSYGFRVEVDTDLVEGDYRNVAGRSIERLSALRSSFASEPVCLISGGEVSCTVSGNGVGGRNQEFVLYCAAQLGASELLKGAAVLSCGTDGIDGNSRAAGAVADQESVVSAAKSRIDVWSFINSNDSYSFFKRTGGLVVTGPTGNNVRDLRILMAQ